MLRSAIGKVMWVGRATVFLVGLAIILALVFGMVSRATAHDGFAGLFHLNHNNNVTSALTKLTGSQGAQVLKVDNNGTGPALSLEANTNRAPMVVNAAAGTATGLSADELDGKDSADLQPNVAARLVLSNGAPAGGIPSSATVPGTRLSFASEDYDTAGLHSNSTNRSRLTAPISGVYDISAIVNWHPNETGGVATKSREIRIMRNATPSGDDGDMIAFVTGPSPSNADFSQPVSTQAYLDAGDYLEVWVSQSSGVNLGVFPSTTHFEMTWVAPG